MTLTVRVAQSLSGSPVTVTADVRGFPRVSLLFNKQLLELDHKDKDQRVKKMFQISSFSHSSVIPIRYT
ncbi:hypothetical protein Cantr_00805 [Candida viswanathii]|uniref:Uncharacterized protein n=1 Tax=Candida viswanathii TaxID=5486 RepID=A0A367YIJ6_9ASCO|nr:hypothetical protein Cantr_00805 [Candida viswanathii]